MSILRGFIPLGLICLVVAPALGQTPPVLNEFFLDGTELRCAMSFEGTGPSTPEETRAAFKERCLSIGDIHVLMTRADAEALLPPADEEPVVRDGVHYVTYTHVIDNEPAGYYVLGYADEVIVSIQAAGREVSPPAQFSSVGLSTSADEIIERFGAPERVTPMPDLGGEEWFYGVFTFIIVDPVGVYSILLQSPEMIQQ